MVSHTHSLDHRGLFSLFLWKKRQVFPSEFQVPPWKHCLYQQQCSPMSDGPHRGAFSEIKREKSDSPTFFRWQGRFFSDPLAKLPQNLYGLLSSCSSMTETNLQLNPGDKTAGKTNLNTHPLDYCACCSLPTPCYLLLFVFQSSQAVVLYTVSRVFSVISDSDSP